jgi:sialate O-acetylesterase
MAKVEGRETKELLKEWADKIAAYDAQADLQSRIQRHNDNEKKKPSGKPAPSDLRPGPVADMNRPGRCYASVIRPLTGLAVKGAVWHQGFNNCFDGTRGARMYYQVFGKMITAWRATFDAPEMPFCILSLCTADAPQTHDNFLKPMHDAGAYIREAQYRTFLDFRNAGDKNIGFGSSFDLRKSWYHPQIKIPVGERAAKWALATQYGAFKGGDADDYWLPPTIKEVKVVTNTLRLTMSTEVTMKDDSEPEMTGFAIAGHDRRFFPAEVRYFSEPGKDNAPKTNRRVLVLSSPFVPEPAHYRYAWARNPMANITNNRQVILPAQRSDDWPMEESPLKFPDASAAKQGANLTRKELELGDTERQLKKSEATIARMREKFEKDKKALEESKRAKGVTGFDKKP